MQQTATYARRVQELIEDWATLTGQSDDLSKDPRMKLISRLLAGIEPNSLVTSTLCADGSPVEFCERVSRRPQGVALTVEPCLSTPSDCVSTGWLRSLLQDIASEEEISFLGKRLQRLEKGIRNLWIGADLGRRRDVRIYCHLTPQAAAEVSSNLDTDRVIRGLDLELPVGVRQTITGILRRGSLRVVCTNINGESGATKLAFAHPLEEIGVREIADRCGIPDELICEYMQRLSPSRGGWRRTRCGIALALDQAGDVQGLTVYHYAAPYFLDDEALRSFVLQLGKCFLWDTTAYRYVSRLLDREGDRIRTLIGFTVSSNGEPSIRLYGRSGALVGS